MVPRAEIATRWERARTAVRGVDTSYLLGAVLAVQAGDVLTTWVGIYGMGLAERNPLMEAVLARVGMLGLVATKFWWYGLAIAGAALVDDSRQMLKYCFLVYLLVGGVALLSNVVVLAALSL